MDLLFDFDIEPLLKTRADRRTNFVIFVVWSALIVGGWVVVVWGRKFCLGSTEISSFVFLV